MNKQYPEFLAEIKTKIRQARLQARRSINVELIQLYWEIGKVIAERCRRLGWGSRVVERLAADLRKEYPGSAGFSARNLNYMRKFYQAYRRSPIVQPLVAQIDWAHHVVLLDKVADPQAVAYYIQAVKEHGWSRRFLANRIELDDYGRNLPNARQSNFRETLPAAAAEKASALIKNSYALEFLGIGEDVDVKELDFERSLVTHLRDFLIELGTGFAFVGNQYRVELAGKEYFIDLLFFHRQLRRLVAVELKMGEFKPEYAGKMNFYLNLLDARLRLPGENRSIGIILCKSKNRLEVEYALRGMRKPIGVAQYVLTRTLPKRLARELPSPEQLRRGLLDEGGGR